MPLKPPPHPEPVKAGLERFGVYGTRWGAMAVIALVALWGAHTSAPPVPAQPAVDGALPLQQWTAAVNMSHFVASASKGAMPKPDPRQRKPPCDPDVEREHGGYCWIPLGVPPPCPKGKAWEKDGACLMPSVRAARVPTTGEIRPGNVAGEAQ